MIEDAVGRSMLTCALRRAAAKKVSPRRMRPPGTHQYPFTVVVQNHPSAAGGTPCKPGPSVLPGSVPRLTSKKRPSDLRSRRMSIHKIGSRRTACESKTKTVHLKCLWT